MKRLPLSTLLSQISSRLRINNLNLRSKLTGILLIVTLIPVSLLGILNYRVTRSTLIEQGQAKLLGTAGQTAAALGNFIKDNRDAIKAEAQLPDIVDYLSLQPQEHDKAEYKNRVFKTLNLLYNKEATFIVSYSLLDSTGSVVVSTTVTDIGLDRSKEVYFLGPSQTGFSYVSPVFFSKIPHRKAGFYFSSPVRHEFSRKIIGILVLHYDANILQYLINQHSNPIKTDTFICLVDENLLRIADTSISKLTYKLVVPRR